MVVLVTGGTGQVGRALHSLIANYKDFDFVFCSSSELDITDEAVCRLRLEQHKPDVLINLAAFTAVDLAEEQPENAYRVNATGAKLLSELCCEYKTILVHLSTDYVFDGLKREPYTINDVPNPLNVYGASKLKGECFIRENMTDYYIIRTSWVYSDFGNNFKKTMLYLATKLKEIKVVDDQVGCPTSADEVARAIMKCIIVKPSFGVLHFCGPQILSWYGFARKIFTENRINISLFPISSEAFNSKAIRPFYSVLEISEFFKEK